MSQQAPTPETAEPTVLVYDFKNAHPVELLDFTGSLLAVGDQYKAFIRRRRGAWVEDDYKLYIKEVRSGSIIAELIDFATQGQLLPAATPFVIDFASQLGQWFDFFKGAKDVADVSDWLFGVSKKDLQQISQIVEPVAKDNSSQINIIAQQGSTIFVQSSLTSVEANAVQNRIRRHIDSNPLPATGVHLDQVLYWYQVRADAAAKPGDRAIIERFARYPVRVRFASDDVKRQMLDGQENPFRMLFVVDVDVTFVDDKPVLYRVLEVKDSFERPE